MSAVPDYDYAMSDFANRVSAWAIEHKAPTFGDAASALRVPVQQIADAVEFHYWMFTMDTDLPLARRRIEHDGE